MKVGDPEYKRQIELINAFPTSCKVDEDNMDKYSDKDMERFEEHSERILREQVRAYSDTDLKIIADEITKIGEKTGVQIKCQREEIFDKMHRI